MEAVLDSNFIISCLRRKIDFFDELTLMGFKPVIPREVLQEIKDIRSRGGVSHEDRMAIDLVFQIIERRKIKKIGFGSGRVDEQLIRKGKEGVYIATLDKGIQRRVPNRIVIKSAENKLIVERD